MGLFVLRALVAVCLVSCASSCSCFYDGPQFLQDIFCEAKYVIQVKVLAQEEIQGGLFGQGELRYTLGETVVYQSSADYNGVADPNSLYTASNSAACGVYLAVGTTYIISGEVSNGQLRVNLCGSFYRLLSELTFAQLCYLRSDAGYAEGCKKCEIKYCKDEKACDAISPVGKRYCIGNQEETEFTSRNENDVCTRVSRRYPCQWSNLSGPLGTSICGLKGR